MKKALSLLLCFVLLLSLCACGGKEEPEATAAVQTPTVAATIAGTETPATDAPQSTDGTEASQDASEDPVEIVRSMIDQPIEDLYARIGQPERADYAPSCMGDGEDGMLFYDGFVVYTYREGDTETVYDVE